MRESALALGRDMRFFFEPFNIKFKEAQVGWTAWKKANVPRAPRRTCTHRTPTTTTSTPTISIPQATSTPSTSMPLLPNDPLLQALTMPSILPSDHLHFLSRNWIIHIWIFLGPLCFICLWVVCLCCPLYFQVLCNQVCLCHPCPWTLECPCAPCWVALWVLLGPHQWSLTLTVWLTACHFCISVLDCRFGCMYAFLTHSHRLNKTP